MAAPTQQGGRANRLGPAQGIFCCRQARPLASTFHYVVRLCLKWLGLKEHIRTGGGKINLWRARYGCCSARSRVYAVTINGKMRACSSPPSKGTTATHALCGHMHLRTMYRRWPRTWPSPLLCPSCVTVITLLSFFAPRPASNPPRPDIGIKSTSSDLARTLVLHVHVRQGSRPA